MGERAGERWRSHAGLLWKIGGRVTSCARVRGQPRRLSRQIGKHALGHLLRQLRGAHLPQCGGKHQVHMPPDQLGKRLLGAMPGVAGQQFQIRVVHFHKHIATRRKIRQRNLLFRPFWLNVLESISKPWFPS